MLRKKNTIVIRELTKSSTLCNIHRYAVVVTTSVPGDTPLPPHRFPLPVVLITNPRRVIRRIPIIPLFFFVFLLEKIMLELIIRGGCCSRSL